MAVVFVARKVFTYGNGSCRNKGDGQREAWHVDQGKRTLGSGAITKGKGLEWFSYKYGTEFTEPSQAPSSTSEKVEETPIASAGTCSGSGASNAQKVLARESEIEGPVQRLSWELWPLRSKGATQVRNEVSSVRNEHRSLGSRLRFFAATPPDKYRLRARRRVHFNAER